MIKLVIIAITIIIIIFLIFFFSSRGKDLNQKCEELKKEKGGIKHEVVGNKCRICFPHKDTPYISYCEDYELEN